MSDSGRLFLGWWFSVGFLVLEIRLVDLSSWLFSGLWVAVIAVWFAFCVICCFRGSLGFPGLFVLFCWVCLVHWGWWVVIISVVACVWILVGGCWVWWFEWFVELSWWFPWLRVLVLL